MCGGWLCGVCLFWVFWGLHEFGGLFLSVWYSCKCVKPASSSQIFRCWGMFCSSWFGFDHPTLTLLVFVGICFVCVCYFVCCCFVLCFLECLWCFLCLWFSVCCCFFLFVLFVYVSLIFACFSMFGFVCFILILFVLLLCFGLCLLFCFEVVKETRFFLQI